MEECELSKLKALRQKSGIPISKCKEALVKSNWDLEKAMEILKETYKDLVNKKQNVPTTDTLAVVYQSNNSLYFTQLHCQTDFVAKSKELADLAVQIIESHIKNIDYTEFVQREIVKLSSNITVDPINSIDGYVYYYIYNCTSENTGSRIGIVQLAKPNPDVGRTIGLQIIISEPENIETLLKTEYFKDSSKTMASLLGDNTILQFHLMR